LDENAFGLRLREKEEEREGRVFDPDVEQGQATASSICSELEPNRRIADVDEGLGDAQPAQYLECPWLDRERP
jgi:hypothetical protein